MQGKILPGRNYVPALKKGGKNYVPRLPELFFLWREAPEEIKVFLKIGEKIMSPGLKTGKKLCPEISDIISSTAISTRHNFSPPVSISTYVTLVDIRFFFIVICQPNGHLAVSLVMLVAEICHSSGGGHLHL